MCSGSLRFFPWVALNICKIPMLLQPAFRWAGFIFWNFLLERLYDNIEIIEVHVENNLTIFLTACFKSLVITLCHCLIWYRNVTHMVPGNITLVWSILIVLLSDHIQQTRYDITLQILCLQKTPLHQGLVLPSHNPIFLCCEWNCKVFCLLSVVDKNS